MTAATIPTGISLGASSVREMMSAKSMSTAPTSTHAGTSARKFGPTRRRAMCGHTSPTKVRPPPTAQASPEAPTATAVRAAVARGTFTPRPVAAASPSPSTFSVREA